MHGRYVLLQLVIFLPATVSLKLQGLEPDPIVQGTGLAMSEFVGVVEGTGLTIGEALLEYSTDLVADPTTYKALEGLSLVETAGDLGGAATADPADQYAGRHYHTQSNGTMYDDGYVDWVTTDPDAIASGTPPDEPDLSYLLPPPGLDGWHCINGSASCYTKGGHWKGKKIRRVNNEAAGKTRRSEDRDDSADEEAIREQNYFAHPDPHMIAGEMWPTRGMQCMTQAMYDYDDDKVAAYRDDVRSGGNPAWPLGYDEDIYRYARYLGRPQVIFNFESAVATAGNKMATLENCIYACLHSERCAAFTGVIGEWCIGCSSLGPYSPLFAVTADYKESASGHKKSYLPIESFGKDFRVAESGANFLAGDEGYTNN